MRRLARWRFEIILVFIALIVRPAIPQEIRRDGNWWRTINPEVKTSYVVGFFDGLALGHNFSYWSLNGKEGKPDIAERARVMDSYDESYRLLKNTTSGQFADVLDKLYSDSRNRRIMVLDAVWIVALGINGMPDKDMEILLNNSRKSAGLFDK